METNCPLKIWVYTFCYNEEKILPYVIEYWKQYATKVIVYDNGSTDNSLKILSQYSWIEVREFDTENTFDPEKISQYKSFCYADAIGKADYVMVCDIDEVLLPTENLLPELVLAKKDNVQLFQTKYYEIINNELNPKYDSLIHTAEGYYAYPNANIHKAIVFDPQIKIAFGHNSLTYSTNRNYITKSIITLHLKMISSNILVFRQKNLYSRLNKKYKYQDDALYYGNIKNIGTRISYFKLLFPYKYRFNKNENYITIFDDIYTMIKNNIKFKDLTWLPTEINHNSKSSNKECIFGIPIYKSDLSTIEKASLTQLCKIIQNKFEICLICQEDLNLREYVDIADKYSVKLSTLFCAKQYFMGTDSYSYMCETADFYKCFSEYKYLFIYQLDGWIFEDNVQKYLDLDVDYIGSPWNVGSFNLPCDTIGNGGVSLRKVQKFIDVCNSFTPEDYEKDWVKTEDLFFCKTMKSKANFKLPTVQAGSNFSLCGLWGKFMTKYNDGKLPMCLHGWHRDYSSYWKKYINLDEFETTGDIKIVQQPIQPVQKSDYKTRLELIKMRLNKSNKPINIQAPAKIENTKIENKKEITQKTTMSSGYANFYKDYYGIKNPMKWESDKHTTNKQQMSIKSVVPAKKVEEKKVEVKQRNVKNDNILICIFNYKHDDNARRWLNLLSPYFETYVLDSGNDKINKDFIQFPNIYYSGLFNETKKLSERKTYDFIGIICSDVTINDNNTKKFIDRVNWLSTTKNVGIWQAAADTTSRSIHGHVTQNESIQYKICIEGWLIFMKADIVKKMPFITSDNKYGWNIDTVSEYISYNLNLLNIIDNNCVVHHPADRGYPELPARTQGKNWQKTVLQQISVPVYTTIKKDIIKYNADITFIIVNRGGANIHTVIQNFNNTFNNYFNKLEFIVVEQCDNNLFMRGQLYNIGVKYANTRYIALIDNDIYNLTQFDIIDTYTNIGPYVAFTKIAQLELKNGIYVKTISEKRLGGFGAFNVLTKDDFISCNGFSNLCFGWGSEDNILNEKIQFARLNHELGHITHPRRNNTNIKSTNNNNKIWYLYKHKEIKSNNDGYIQTTYNVIYNKKEDNVLYLGVNNIGVCDNYIYKIEYQNALKIAGIDIKKPEKIIITMTSWKKRINNVNKVLSGIINYQLTKPDLCVINLSSEEFPKKEKELPENLIELINKSNIPIEINWIDGPNTKQWKKILPTLQKYPNDVIICIDDDFEYPNDFIQTLYNKHLEFPNNPISGNTVKMFGVKCHCGCASLVKNEFFDNIQQYFKDPKIYNFYSSDIFFTYVAEKSKHSYIYAGKQFFTNMKAYNAVDALSQSKIGGGNGIKMTWDYLISTYGKL